MHQLTASYEFWTGIAGGFTLCALLAACWFQWISRSWAEDRRRFETKIDSLRAGNVRAHWEVRGRSVRATVPDAPAVPEGAISLGEGDLSQHQRHGLQTIERAQRRITDRHRFTPDPKAAVDMLGPYQRRALRQSEVG